MKADARFKFIPLERHIGDLASMQTIHAYQGFYKDQSWLLAKLDERIGLDNREQNYIARSKHKPVLLAVS
jgi:hypothetical protein